MKKGINDLTRLPPNNIEAEEAIISILLDFPVAFDVTKKYLKPSMFYKEIYGRIYLAMETLNDKEGAFDYVTLSAYMQKHYLDDGILALQLIKRGIPSTYIERHCMIVLELYLKRQCIIIFSKYTNKIYDNTDIADVYDNVKRELDSLFNINEEDINRIVQYEKCILYACLKDDTTLATVHCRLTPDMLYKSVHKDIYVAMIALHDMGYNISLESVSNMLIKNHNREAAIELKEMEAYYSDEWNYYLTYLIDNNNLKLLHKIASIIISHNYKSVNEVLEKIIHIADTITQKELNISTMRSVAKRNIRKIRNISDGKQLSYIKTKEQIINEVCPFGPDNTVVLAGMASSGKTRYMIHLMKGILELNEDVAILWFSMEDSDDKVLRCFISSDVNLTENQMLSKEFKLSDTQITLIEEAQSKYENYDIEFVCEPSSINTITSKFRAFVKKRPGKFCILLVDNFMLINEVFEATSNTTAVEDNIMSQFTVLKKQTNKDGYMSSIFILHHITKEVTSKFNKEEGYRPRMSMLKGTTRVIDAATIVLLINNLGQHKDLIREHSKLPDVECLTANGTYKLFKRSKIMQNMMIIDVAKNREGEIADDKGLIRIMYDFGKMKFNNLKFRRS